MELSCFTQKSTSSAKSRKKWLMIFISWPRHDKVREFNQLQLELQFDEEELQEYRARYAHGNTPFFQLTPADFADYDKNNVPSDRLMLALGMIVMVMRNIRTEVNNGMRARVIEMHPNYAVIRMEHSKEEVIIHRIAFVLKLGGVKISRMQFPLVPVYAATINKSQGATMSWKHIGDLTSDCFQCGQLYVLLSRCTRPSDLTIVTPDASREVLNIVNPFFVKASGASVIHPIHQKQPT
jgi:hypothetical protein